jgi:YhcH/YjgK/YiaL family protein
LEAGRHTIDGDNLFVNVMDVQLKAREQAALEVHDRYVDIQIMVGNTEEYGWSERRDCHSPREEFNSERDVQFFTDVPQTFFSLNERQFAIFFPEDAHAPMLGEGSVRKLIFKLLM